MYEPPARRRSGNRHRTDPAALARDRTVLRVRLEARRDEIEDAMLARTYGIADPFDADPVYLEGLRASVSIALDYALDAVERGEERSPPPPPQLLAQARMAARYGIALDVVLRRYVAGYTMFSDFLRTAATEADVGAVPARSTSGRVAFDRLLAAVSEEHGREVALIARDPNARRTELLRRLLVGELHETAELPYELKAHHVAVLVSPPPAPEVLAGLAERLDRQLLLAHPDRLTVWAWFGGRREFHVGSLDPLESYDWPETTSLACGRPAHGVAGWRLSHRQAAATLPIARRLTDTLVHYADVALIASAFRDDLLTISLHRLYLEPLERERDGGENALATLRAYFAAERNISSAAARLGVSRQAVAKRLQAVEERLGRSLSACGPELEVALRLAALRTPLVARQADAEAPWPPA